MFYFLISRITFAKKDEDGNMAPQVNSCCCGCNLETGSILISIFELFLALLMIGGGIYGLERPGVPGEDEDVFRVVLIILICIGSLSGLFAVLLLIGTVKKIPPMVKAWVIWMTVWVSLTLTGIVLSLIHGQPSNALSLLLVAPRLYFIIVTRSLHVEMSSCTGTVVSTPAYPPSQGYEKFDNNIA